MYISWHVGYTQALGYAKCFSPAIQLICFNVWSCLCGCRRRDLCSFTFPARGNALKHSEPQGPWKALVPYSYHTSVPHPFISKEPVFHVISPMHDTSLSVRFEAPSAALRGTIPELCDALTAGTKWRRPPSASRPAPALLVGGGAERRHRVRPIPSHPASWCPPSAAAQHRPDSSSSAYRRGE